MNEKIATPGERSYLSRIASVTASNPQQVTFTYREPYFKALDMVAQLPILAEHYYAKFLEDPEAFNQSKTAIMGTGHMCLITSKVRIWPVVKWC